MAHSWRTGPGPLAILAATLASIAPDARAIALGEAEVRSALGESLDLRIPVTVGRGESIEPACFTLSRDPAATVPRLGAARLSLERSAQGTRLRIRSGDPVNEPALILGVTVACPGQTSEYQREYSILLDPRPGPPVAAASAPAAPKSIAATLIARIGDTLESIANAIFPRNRGAKKSYIEALRETNPPLSSLADNDPIPVDTPIALPDLRTFAGARPSSAETQIASAPRPKPALTRAPPAPRVTLPTAPRVAAAPPERPVAPPASPPRQREERPAAPSPLPAHRTARGRTTPGYQLKLSSVEVDLTRSRAIDDRSRAQLRDRQLILDADDQVAAVLALRNSVRQLETRVAELQLKLAGMPAVFPPPKAEVAVPAPAPKPPAPAPKPLEPPKVAAPAPAPQPPAPAPKPVEPPKIAAVEPAKTAPKALEPAAPVIEPPKPAPVEPPKAAMREPPPPAVAPPPAVTPDARPAPPAAKPAAPSTGYTPAQRYGLWGLVVLLVAVTLLLVWRLVRRRREEAYVPEVDEPIVVAEEPERIEPVMTESAPAALEPRSMASDASLPTRLPAHGADDLRRRYIEERFPEILNGTIVLDDPDSVIKGARLFYEDGALTRAIELLHFAIERRPAEIKNWLALFEVFRLERLSGQFADLALRFKEQHGTSDYWRKVQYFGREIDPGNSLYQDESFKSLETIGVAASALSIAAESTFDPIAENWLNAPMDFENEVLANELRKALMVGAGINDQDLVPNPMPALRNVEMFTVA